MGPGPPSCSCTGRPGYYSSPLLPSVHFLHPIQRSPEVCSTCSLCPYFLCQQQRLLASRKKSPKVSKFLLLEIEEKKLNLSTVPLKNNLLGCMQLMRFTRKLMILEDISGAGSKLKPNLWTYNFVEVSGHNLEILRLKVSRYNVPVSNHFCSRWDGEGNKIHFSRRDCE
jgi:hypothetical protein